ncbi:t-SNARE [Coemansia spiralis]|nr:t-SNARE [Coemansia spiralis]
MDAMSSNQRSGRGRGTFSSQYAGGSDQVVASTTHQPGRPQYYQSQQRAGGAGGVGGAGGSYPTYKEPGSYERGSYEHTRSAPSQWQGSNNQQPQGSSNNPAARGNHHQLGASAEAKIDSEFYDLIDYLSVQIKRLDEDISKVKSGYQAVLSASNDESRIECAKRRDEQIYVANKAISKIRNGLERLDELKQEYSHDPSVTSSQMAMRASKQQSLARAFAARLEKYKEVGRDYSELYKARLRRQYEIANPNATEDEIDNALESEEAARVFSQAIKKSNRHLEATRVLNNVEQRQADIKQIEKTMAELNEIAQEMSEMVIKQQEQIDNIEGAVEAAHENTSTGVVQVKQAIKYRKSSRKLMWCFLLLIILVAAAIGVGLYFKFRK